MISNELLNFIIDFFDERKIMINEDLINSNTEIYNDLGFDVSDLDIGVFMAEFKKKLVLMIPISIEKNTLVLGCLLLMIM